MTRRAHDRRRRGSYGVDAPYLLPLPLLLFVVYVVLGIVSHSPGPLIGAGLLLACGGCGMYASRRGKFVVWGELLDQLGLRGDERVLDVGCGRGAVLMLAAQRLSTGRAVGIDRWRRGDQSGNAAAATRHNAELEGVAGRVEVCTADMTSLPFADASFDLVVSSLAVHNVSTRAARRRAIDEAARVLRPGGRLLIADLRATGEYQRRLTELGMTHVTRRRVGWRMWWSGPWAPTRVVSATKPIDLSRNALNPQTARAY